MKNFWLERSPPAGWRVEIRSGDGEALFGPADAVNFSPPPDFRRDFFNYTSSHFGRFCDALLGAVTSAAKSEVFSINSSQAFFLAVSRSQSVVSGGSHGD